MSVYWHLLAQYEMISILSVSWYILRTKSLLPIQILSMVLRHVVFGVLLDEEQSLKLSR